MAIEFTPEFCERIHASLETETPLILAKRDWDDLEPYYGSGDFTNYLYNQVDYKDSYMNLFVASLLILAAEEELDGYPMEATNEIS